MKNMIKAVIFDIDGTLADSLYVWTESDKILLERRGLEYSYEVSLALKNMHFNSAVEHLKKTFGLKESAEELGREISDIVRDKYFYEVKLMPYVNELMDMLEENDIKMCAATSNSIELAKGVLENNNILHRLEFVITSDEVGSGKEDPSIFLTCCERLGTKPEETIVFEDSPHAALTAKNAGFYTIGVNSGHFGDFDALADCTHIRIKGFDEFIADHDILQKGGK